MPPKMVKCSVCNETVLKSKTYALADGTRACRSHEGVGEEAKKLREQDKERLRKEVAEKRKPFSHSKEFNLDKFIEDGRKFREEANTHCWTCGAEGIPAVEYFTESIVAIERLKIRGEFNFLTFSDDIYKLLGNPVVLFTLPYSDEDKEIYRSIRNRKVKDIIHFLRSVNMCKECVNKFKVNDRLEALFPKPTWEQLQNMMPVVSSLDPFIKEIAEKKETQNQENKNGNGKKVIQ